MESSRNAPENLSTEALVRRLRYCESRWDAAMLHPGYRDEPSTDRPFSEAESVRYWWADQWRLAFHAYEGELYRRRDVRLGLVEGLAVREQSTVYVDYPSDD